MLLCVLAALVLPVFAAEPDVPAAQSEALDWTGSSRRENSGRGIELDEGLDLEEGSGVFWTPAAAR